MNRFRKQHTSREEKPEPTQPLRDFTYKESATDNSRPNRRPKSRLLYLALTAGLLVVILVVVSIFSSKDRADRPVTREEPVPVSSQSSFVDVPDLLNGYLNALGGRQALQDVRSVRYDGQVQFSSGQKDFQIWLLAPDKGMLVTDPGGFGGQKLVVNGDVAWRVIENRNGAREMYVLDELNTESLKWSLRVHHSLRQMALAGKTAGLKVRESEYLDKPCYELSKTMPQGSEFLAILDKETLYLHKMVETLQVEDEKSEFTVLYDDYRMVSGVVEPYRTTLYKNGELDNEVEVRSIQINSGVMSSLFQVPDDLKKPQNITSRR